ncbi:MAG: hypothetical protein JM58_09530 [Peptococcaceae bacterium BICA1-8]|nr:MAG: hypothetical protein JM58_09530 [Peptococcaceae bacterium BICA1-8]
MNIPNFYPVPKQTHRPIKPPKNIPKSLVKTIYERDRNSCQLCKQKGGNLHHIVSAGMGRRKVHCKENLLLLCHNCHSETHNGKKSEELQKWCEDWSRKKYGNVIDLLKRELRK